MISEHKSGDAGNLYTPERKQKVFLLGKKVNFLDLRRNGSWVPEAHACNPSYSRGRDQEDHSSKPTPGK
jgi:hypothetical protein